MKIHDELTGLYNREGFFEKVKECLPECDRQNYQIIRFDVKNFKFVNAIFGRKSGDKLLTEIGQTLKENDYPEEVCGRLESDRFVVFVSKKHSQQIVRLISNTHFHVPDYDSYPIHIYMGIYQIRKEDKSVSKMCERAGMVLGSIKNNLLEKVAVYDDSLYDNMIKEHQLSLELPSAIREEQLQLYLQPQVDRIGVVEGAEALVRWHHPEKGLLMPGEFIPLFERNYMVVEVDRYIWEKACQLIRKWNDEGRDNLYVSVNVSARDFECIDVCKTLLELIKKYEIKPNQLKVEITESTIMENPLKQIQLVGQLRTAGFFVEMDDFGNGYSSISMLKDINLDAIKLDMRFLEKTAHVDRARKILDAIINLMREFQMEIIAEGVETREQIDYLGKMGCDLFQGFYFSKPVPVDEFERKMFIR
jgi:diguanylate cyclase (GGDEF)-like protein